MTANRVAAIAGALTGLAAFVAGLAELLPGTWPNVAIATAGLLTKLGVVLSYLDGSKKFDAHETEKVLELFRTTGELPGQAEGVKHADFKAPPAAATTTAAPEAGP